MEEASIERDAGDERISKRTKWADTDSRTEPTPEILCRLEHNTQRLAADPDIDLTVWEERRCLVGSFKIDWETELVFVGKLAERHSKNYLVWDYRRWIVNMVGYEAASKELELTKKILSKGAKNYQAWSHREWVIHNFDRSWWLDELHYCKEILKKDISNVLAWDQICRAVRLNPKMDAESRYREASYAEKVIKAQPGNEGPWTYLKCLYMKDKTALYTKGNLERIYVDVLAKEADRIELEADVILDPRMNARYMVHVLADKRGCVHALTLILDLIVLGYNVKENKRLVRAINVLHDYCDYPNWSDGRTETFRKVGTVLSHLDGEWIRYCNMHRGWWSGDCYELDSDLEKAQQELDIVGMEVSQIVAMDNTLPQQSSEQLESVCQDVIASLCRDSIFNDFFNGARRKCLFERLQTYLQERHDLVSALAEDDTKNNLLWVVRRWAVKDVGTDFATKKELEFTRKIIDEDANNSHAWTHRRWAIKDVGNNFDAKNELEFTRKIIDKDANHSHAWSHRRWVFETFGGDWEDDNELECCAEILKQDSCNYFAWDQRYFVLERFLQKIEEYRSNMDADDSDDDSIQFKEIRELGECFERKKSKEVEYAIEVIVREPENQYPWSHIGSLHGSPVQDCRIKNAVLDVLKDERDRVRGLEVSHGIMGASYMNARAMINALNMLLDLHLRGFSRVIFQEPGKDFREVINSLCPGLWPPEAYGFLDNFYSLVVHMDRQGRLASSWRDIADEVLFGGVSHFSAFGY